MNYRNVYGLCLLTALVLGMAACSDAEQTETKSSPELTMSSVLPADVFDTTDTNTQRGVDLHAWSTFINLMWPADSDYRGKPAQGFNPASNAPAVWETFKEQYEIYLPDGSKPPAWNAAQSFPEACRLTMDDKSQSPILYRTQKVDDVLDAVAQAVKTDATLPGTLKDQSGNLVRYEIRFNEVVYDYIVSNKFYNGPLQAKANTISYPDGSIIVKAAWKELEGQELSSYQNRFMTRDACICEDSTMQQCEVAKTGLVGFHVMHKTPAAPQWIWSTFEHVANVNPSHGLPASFNSPNCTGPHCTPNSQTPEGVANQVTQLLPIEADLQVLNTKLQTLFTDFGWVLSNYQLMSAQWPTQAAESSQPPTVFTVQPTFSANTTMETFAQESSSCMGCHVMSRSLNPDKFVSGDFTFTLNNANPKPPGAICNSYSYSNSIFCSEELLLFNPNASPPPSDNVKRGHELVTQTYEKMPAHVGNKLHCSSCHLHAGGDPKAAWWVNMEKDYGTPAKLQHRINGCFERSMNGSTVCVPGSDCDNNKDMSDIIAYMGWLTTAYEDQHSCTIGDPGCPTRARFSRSDY